MDTQPTFRSRISPTARRWWRYATKAVRSNAITADPRGSWYLTFTSGSQQSGSRGLNSLNGMSRASGRHAAIIGVVIPGSNRGTRMTEPVDDASTEARWQSAAVVAIANRTPRIKSFVLAPQAPFHFHSGQHVDLRLTAESGYTAMR